MVGGVMGSTVGGELTPLSSVISSLSTASLVEAERLLVSLLRLMLRLRWGRNDVLGERL